MRKRNNIEIGPALILPVLAVVWAGIIWLWFNNPQLLAVIIVSLLLIILGLKTMGWMNQNGPAHH
jgi:ABC-type sugar transport system permease subunit